VCTLKETYVDLNKFLAKLCLRINSSEVLSSAIVLTPDQRLNQPPSGVGWFSFAVVLSGTGKTHFGV
jgi:hypothetical protein